MVLISSRLFLSYQTLKQVWQFSEENLKTHPPTYHWKKLIKTIRWKCDGFVMVFSEKPVENHDFSQKPCDALSKILVLKTRTFEKPAEKKP